jgi:hypothetical protein
VKIRESKVKCMSEISGLPQPDIILQIVEDQDEGRE